MKEKAIKLIDYIKQNNISDDKTKDIIIKLFFKQDVSYALPKISAYLMELNYELTEFEFIAVLEELLCNLDKVENGVVYTPQHLCTEILDETILEELMYENMTILDPCCGSGAFLVEAVYKIAKELNKPFNQVINENVFGLDILEEHITNTELVLKLICYLNDQDFIGCNLNVCDSLSTNWNEMFNIDKYDFIVGNPPYYNTHDMSKEFQIFLKSNFSTTKKGSYNIFYAFIEKAMDYISENGKLGYIIPNNFLTIKAAEDLRKFLLSKNYIEKVLDFDDLMPFRPVRTYNLILVLSLRENKSVEYIRYSDEVKLTKTPPVLIDYKYLNKEYFKFLDIEEYNYIEKIENQQIKLKSMIKVGIATLKDDVFHVEKKCDNTFIKRFNEIEYEIESEIVTNLYKISKIDRDRPISDSEMYIIHPYKIVNGRKELFSIAEMENDFPKTYKYLNVRRLELEMRDKGKLRVSDWYKYGRSQGINFIGKKIVYPTFTDKPKFLLLKDDLALFSNGYAIFNTSSLSDELLVKILNSDLMEKYVKLISYPIHGGYYCYQKKYIQNFTIPVFSNAEIVKLENLTDDEFNKQLLKLYNIK